MDSIKMEAGMLESPCSPPPSSSPHHQQFLFHLMRMRHFQTAVSDPLLLPSRPYLPEGHLQYAKRPPPVHLDQPLDFSAKKSRMESSPSTAGGWFHQRNSSGKENREFSAAAAEAFISVAAAAAAASAAAGGGDINKHDSLGSDGHSDLSTSHSPQSNGSPRQEDLLYGHHSGPPGGQSLRLHPRAAAANQEEEDNEDRERENCRSPPRLAIPSPSPSPEADPHQPLLSRHHHNGLLTTVASLTQPPLPLLRAPMSGGSLPADPHTPPPGALLGLPLPYFGGTSAAVANKMGNPYALSLAIGSPANGVYRPSHTHHAAHDSSPPRSASGGGGPESMSELTKIAVTSNQKYAEFRENMLRNMENGRSVKNTKKAAAAGGDLNRSYSPATSGSSGVTTSTPTAESHMLLAAQRQSSSEERNSGGENKDEAYWERRRKNNEAAKRSRDARRQKENEIAVRASFLEQENIQLKLELVQLRTELGSLRQQVHQQVRAN
jgi:hypothetical protein